MTNNQMSLFSSEFDERIRRIDVGGVVYFSILDVFEYYGNAKNTRTSWATALRRLEKQGFDSGREILQLQFPGERQRETPTATFQTMLRVAQVTDFKEWEPLRQWMAEVAHERIEEMVNPALGVERATKRAVDAYTGQGRDAEWIMNRLKGIPTRNRLTEVAQQTHETNSPNYGALTNAVYDGTLGAVKHEIVSALGMTKAQAEHFRDYIGEYALEAIESAERLAADKMKRIGRQLTAAEQIEIVRHVARLIAPQARARAEYLGIDLVSGRELVEAPKPVHMNVNHFGFGKRKHS